MEQDPRKESADWKVQGESKSYLDFLKPYMGAEKPPTTNQGGNNQNQSGGSQQGKQDKGSGKK
jgi:hypothetical protein